MAWTILCLHTFLYSTASTQDIQFCFVQISDTHFGSARENNAARAIIEKINALPFAVEFIVHTGDIFADNADKETAMSVATSAFARLQAPLHTLPGNHDILTNRLASTLHAYTNQFGPLASRADYKGVACLFLYTEPLRKEFTIPGYDPMTWLQAQLVAISNTPAILFHHAPPVEDFYDGSIHPGWPEPARASWNDLLRKSSIQAVIAGHFHRNELHWLEDIPLFVGEASASYWGRTPAFRIYEYRNGRLSYRTVYLSPKETSDK